MQADLIDLHHDRCTSCAHGQCHNGGPPFVGPHGLMDMATMSFVGLVTALAGVTPLHVLCNCESVVDSWVALHRPSAQTARMH